MALPLLLRKLFVNQGKGDKLNDAVLPSTVVKSVNGIKPDGNGNVSVNRVEGNLVVTGTVTATSITQTSDNRLKNRISDYEADIASLKAKSFYFNGSDVKSVGLIAQDVQKVIPEAIKINEEGYLSVDYAPIIAVMVDKVNELTKRLNELEGVKA